MDIDQPDLPDLVQINPLSPAGADVESDTADADPDPDEHELESDDEMPNIGDCFELLGKKRVYILPQFCHSNLFISI